jgi:transcriptional regulator with GAF, ATPase, and Fis domain/pSer/pThr/pTyr-binding forkhead associated (FHA) protein
MRLQLRFQGKKTTASSDPKIQTGENNGHSRVRASRLAAQQIFRGGVIQTNGIVTLSSQIDSQPQRERRRWNTSLWWRSLSRKISRYGSFAVTPILSALNGPLRKSAFPICGPLSIGRDSTNSICLEDASASPRHCRITTEGGAFLLTDLDSISGTFVNGIPVKQRALAPGDQIGIGNSLFLFHKEDSRSSPGSVVHLDDSASPSGMAQQLRPDELLYLHPESLAALPQSARLDRALGTLLKISTAIGSIRNVESLQWQLLGMVFDVVPAERGAILLLDGSGAEISSPVAWDRVAGPDHPVHVSRTLTSRVIEGRISILDNQTPGLRSPLSQNTATGDRSILCVPLIVADQVLGLIYLDSSNGALFTPDDLQLVTAIAGLAAIAIENARQFERLGLENQQLRAEVCLRHDMVGNSSRIREVYRFIEKVAPSDSTVLIYGESGTGKELAARAIHNNSTRKDKPFVALNCAALTETLLESELFGHEKGAFTSAICQKKGLLEIAEGGSVFLDEVRELPLTLQAKLLRVLQEREFLRVGGTRPIKLNVRFLAATNKDLQKAVQEGTFRPDLYYRLNVVSRTMPALRERKEDIPLLAAYFAGKHAQRCSRRIKGISQQAQALLAQHDWPGNIRELENAVERAVVLGSSDMIVPEDLPEALLESAVPVSGHDSGYHAALRQLKKQLILQAVEQSSGNLTEAAKLLALHPNYLHRLIRNLELRVTLKKQCKV